MIINSGTLRGEQRINAHVVIKENRTPLGDVCFVTKVGNGEITEYLTIKELDGKILALEAIRREAITQIAEEIEVQAQQWPFTRSENPNAQDNGPSVHDLPDTTDPDGDFSDLAQLAERGE